MERDNIHRIAFALVFLATAAWAQEDVQIRVTRLAVGPPDTAAPAPQAASAALSHMQYAFGGQVVEAAPFTADAVLEFRQTLADGTQIARNSQSFIARDSQGRRRYETTMAAPGLPSSTRDAPRIVTIIDPVAGETYILNEREKTAEKIKLPARAATTAAGDQPGTQKTEAVLTRREGGGAVSMERKVVVTGGQEKRTGSFLAELPPPPAPGMAVHQVMVVQRTARDQGEQESLGVQTIEGLQAEGTRIRQTIAAGEIGNDRPLVTTIERWYSPELKEIVISRTNDPQAGETVQRLINIRRGEPARSLFQVPADYTVREAAGPQVRRVEVK